MVLIIVAVTVLRPFIAPSKVKLMMLLLMLLLARVAITQAVTLSCDGICSSVNLSSGLNALRASKTQTRSTQLKKDGD